MEPVLMETVVTTPLAISEEARKVRDVLIERGLQTLLETDDVAVTINAAHYCVKARGVMDANSRTRTTALGGQFKADPRTRSEFLA
jgi:GTP cyclohydrolase I